jgi:hypothetical protein
MASFDTSGPVKSSGFTGDDRDIAHNDRVIAPHRIQLVALSACSDSKPRSLGIP